MILLFKDLPRDAMTSEVAHSGSPKRGFKLTWQSLSACCANFWQLFVASAVTLLRDTGRRGEGKFVRGLRGG